VKHEMLGWLYGFVAWAYVGCVLALFYIQKEATRAGRSYLGSRFLCTTNLLLYTRKNGIVEPEN
jgi:hypothetical protein